MVGLSDECWEWIGAKDRKGYGNFTVNKRKTGKAHRFSFALYYKKLPKKLHVDHKCENTSCVNPNHLQLLTNKKNNEKSNSASAVNKRKTHCIKNHEFNKNNTYIDKRGSRRCKICEKERKSR